MTSLVGVPALFQTCNASLQINNASGAVCNVALQTANATM
jgi:hypothetical protein